MRCAPSGPSARRGAWWTPNCPRWRGCRQAGRGGALANEKVCIAASAAWAARKGEAERAAGIDLGADVWASVAPSVTRVLAFDLDDPIAAAAARQGHALLDVRWLEWVRARGGGGGTRRAAPPPRFFLALGDGEAGRPPDSDERGDPYYDVGEPEDVAAVLKRFMGRAAAADGARTRSAAARAALPPPSPAPLDATTVGEAELAAENVRRPPRPLAGARVFVLRPPTPPPPPIAQGTPTAPASWLANAATAAHTADDVAAAALTAAAVAAGGAAALSLDDATHAVALPPRPPPATPRADPPPACAVTLLEGVWDAAGAGGLAALRAALARGVSLVAPTWVEAATDRGVHPAEGDHWPSGVEADVAAWPWGAYGVADPPPPPPAASGNRAEAAATTAAAAACPPSPRRGTRHPCRVEAWHPGVPRGRGRRRSRAITTQAPPPRGNSRREGGRRGGGAGASDGVHPIVSSGGRWWRGGAPAAATLATPRVAAGGQPAGRGRPAAPVRPAAAARGVGGARADAEEGGGGGQPAGRHGG